MSMRLCCLGNRCDSDSFADVEWRAVLRKAWTMSIGMGVPVFVCCGQILPWEASWVQRRSVALLIAHCAPLCFLPPPPTYSSPTTDKTMQTMQTAALSHLPPNMNPITHRTQYARPSIGNASSSTNRAMLGLAITNSPLTTRKRKRPHQYSVSYSEVQEVDPQGKVRDVIVIEDTPPPPANSPAMSSSTHINGYSTSYQPPLFSAPIRTRARAAAEAQAVTASTSSAVISAPSAKRRKRELADDGPSTSRRPALSTKSIAVATTKSWASGSGATTEDVCAIFSSIDRRLQNMQSCRHPKDPLLVTTKRDITSSSKATSFINDVRLFVFGIVVC